MTSHATSTTWRLQLLVNDERRGLWGQERRVVLFKRAGESRDHVVLKLLGLVLFFHDDLVVEHPERVSVYKSDLSRRDARGDVVQWIECGLVSAFKLDRLTRALGPAVVVEVLKKGTKTAVELRRAIDEDAAHADRVVVNAVDAGFVDALGAALDDGADALGCVVRADDDGFVAVDVSVEGRSPLLGRIRRLASS